MEKEFIGGIEIIRLNENDMADYFTRAFSRASTKDMLTSAPSLSSAEEYYQNFANILQAYTCATGDLSNKTIDDLSYDFAQHRDIFKQAYDTEKKITSAQKYFGEFVMPKIIAIHSNKLNLKQPLSWKDSCCLLSSVETQSNNNKFKTHSFNGALLDEIKKNGLDINKELFKDEFSILSISGMIQPYQKGNLLFCEMSRASFGYSLRAPERLVMSLSKYGHNQQDAQPTNEFLTQSLEAKLAENEKLNITEKANVLQAGKTMINFYFGVNNKSAIAIKKDNLSYTNSSTDKYIKSIGKACSCLLMEMSVKSFCKREEDSAMSEQYALSVADFKERNNVDKLESFVNKFNQKYPENKLLKEAYSTFMVKNLTESCVNNFTYNGNADGYVVPGGRLATNQFALAEFQNPIDVYVSSKQITNKLASLRKVMAKKIDKKLGTNIDKLKLPTFIKKTENALSQIMESKKKKK